jgi:lysylphosphatidylglycerol synthetase-like protein (DUF2156 family)
VICFQKPPREGRANIVFPALMAYWFAYCIYRLDRIRLHPNSIDATLAIVMGLLAGGAWLVTTPGRLHQLRLHKAWIIVMVSPFALSIFALWNQWNIAGWLMLVAALLAQWLLVFLSLGPDSRVEQSERSDIPTP